MKKQTALLALLLIATALSGCRVLDDSQSGLRAAPVASSSVSDPTGPEAAAVRALAELDTLPVKGRAPKTGYSREEFGQAWSDDVSVTYGHNGCDTRNDILRRDLIGATAKNGSRCLIATGTLRDPYTATTIDFVRGPRSADVQIDHVVALADAWQKGAQQLTDDQRRNLANDPRNLLAVDGETNQRKGAGDAATWLPPATGYRCTYVAKQITVKKIYGLWVTPAEKQAMSGLLNGCAR